MTVAVALVLYFGACLVLGLLARRVSARSPEEYFLADRTLAGALLFMSLFGTNVTAFLLVGIPGRAYHEGLGVFSVNAPILALLLPLSFWAVGGPAREVAARLGALTPTELYRKRFGSTAVGVVLFLAFTAYTIPYMVTGIVGSALTLAATTQGTIPPWLGGLLVLAVTLLYTALGGMRATAWTNVLQGTIFALFLAGALVGIVASMGGLGGAFRTIAARRPELLVLGTSELTRPGGWISWSLAISLTVVAFPHMLVRLMAAKDDRALRQTCRVYPLALLVIWVPAVLIGVLGAVDVPGLAGRDSDRILSLMTARHLPPWFGGLAFVAVLAAVMSTLDAQVLTLSSMLVRDVARPAGWLEPGSRREVVLGQAFVVLLSAAVYALSLVAGGSVFEIAQFAFSGYVTLVPALFLGVRWRRFTSAGAIASIVAGTIVLALGLAGWLPLAGFLPVFWAFVAALAAAIGVSLVTAPPGEALVKAAFGS